MTAPDAPLRAPQNAPSPKLWRLAAAGFAFDAISMIAAHPSVMVIILNTIGLGLLAVVIFAAVPGSLVPRLKWQRELDGDPGLPWDGEELETGEEWARSLRDPRRSSKANARRARSRSAQHLRTRRLRRTQDDADE